MLFGMSLRKIHAAHHHRVSRNSSVPRPTMMSHARWTTFTSWMDGRSATGISSSPWTSVDVPSTGIGEDRGEPGDGDSSDHLALGVEVTEQHLRHVGAGLRHHLDRGELRRLLVVDPARQPVADAHLDRRRDRGDREADDEAQPVVPVAAAAQHPDRVDGGDHEAADQVRRHHHVGGHQRHGVVEDHAHRVDVDHLAGGVEGDALRESSSTHWPRPPRCCRRHPPPRWARRSRSAPTASAGATRRCRSR